MPSTSSRSASGERGTKDKTPRRTAWSGRGGRRSPCCARAAGDRPVDVTGGRVQWPGMSRPAVELDHVSKTYREGDSERSVLRDVSVAIAPGEIAVLVGRSGSGKSTVLNLIAG